MDNEPLRHKLTIPRFARVTDNQGRVRRGYSVGDNIYVSASQSENTKYVHLGRYIDTTANPETTKERIILKDSTWEELCRKKHIVSELAMQYRTTNVNGASTHHEKFRMLLGDQIYVSLHVKDNVAVDIRYFDYVFQTVCDDDGKFIHQWTVIPSKRGISMKLDQWFKLTSLEGLNAVDHLKALSTAKCVPKKQREDVSQTRHLPKRKQKRSPLTKTPDHVTEPKRRRQSPKTT